MNGLARAVAIWAAFSRSPWIRGSAGLHQVFRFDDVGKAEVVADLVGEHGRDHSRPPAKPGRFGPAHIVMPLPPTNARPLAVLSLVCEKPGTIRTMNRLSVFGSGSRMPPAAAALVTMVFKSPVGRGLLLPGVPVLAKVLL